MSKVEDILYEAHRLGIYKDVMSESKRLNKKYPYKEVGERMEMALTKIIKKKKIKII
tara:strand:+ start:171 stop:341 length:171 start_codon:yes stop_codon:yes gene_type:complete